MYILSNLVNVTATAVYVENSSFVNASDDVNTISLTTSSPPSASTALSSSVGQPPTIPTTHAGRSAVTSTEATSTMLLQTEAVVMNGSSRNTSHVTPAATTATAVTAPRGSSHQRQQQQQPQPPPPNVSPSSPQQQNATSVHVRVSTFNNGGGLPVALLWLPYVALTFFLTALLIASFVHFHCKNGHKYKRRRSASNQALGSSLTGNGASWRDPIVEHIVENTSNPVSEITIKSLLSFDSTAAGDVTTDRAGARLTRCDVGRDRKYGRSSRRQSVEFISNRNGSMVNMRGCGKNSTMTSTTGCYVMPLDDRQHTVRPVAVSQCRGPSEGLLSDKIPPQAAAVFRSNSSLAPTNNHTLARPTRCRFTSGRGRIGFRVATTAIDATRVSSDGGGVCPSSCSSLYSAVRICKMDETADDWNRLLAASGQSHR